MSRIILAAYDPSARDDAGTSPDDGGGKLLKARAYRRGV